MNKVHLFLFSISLFLFTAGSNAYAVNHCNITYDKDLYLGVDLFTVQDYFGRKGFNLVKDPAQADIHFNIETQCIPYSECYALVVKTIFTDLSSNESMIDTRAYNSIFDNNRSIRFMRHDRTLRHMPSCKTFWKNISK